MRCSKARINLSHIHTMLWSERPEHLHFSGTIEHKRRTQSPSSLLQLHPPTRHTYLTLRTPCPRLYPPAAMAPRLDVIGLGLCRTGTMSTAAALTRLGLGPCYHMSEVVKGGHMARWIELSEAQEAGARVHAGGATFSICRCAYEACIAQLARESSRCIHVHLHHGQALRFKCANTCFIRRDIGWGTLIRLRFERRFPAGKTLSRVWSLRRYSCVVNTCRHAGRRRC